MKAVYTVCDVVDELTTCQRRVKGLGLTDVLQPYIAKNFDEYMGGVDIA